jgi:hypothetical protein
MSLNGTGDASVRGGNVLAVTVVQHCPVHRDIGSARGTLGAYVVARLAAEIVGQRAAGHHQIQLGGELIGQVDIRLLLHARLAQQLLAFVAEALAQPRQQPGVVGQRERQPLGIADVLYPQDLADVLVMLQELLQCPQIAQRVGFPAVVEEHAHRGEQAGAGILVVLLGLTEDELGDAAALVVHGQLLLVIVLPRLRQGVVVDDAVRVLHPAQEGLAAFQVGTHVQLALGQLLIGQASVLRLGGGLDALAHLQVAQITERHPEHVEILGGVARQLHRRRGLHAFELLGRLQVALQALPVMVEDVRVFGHELLDLVLDPHQAVHDGGA